MIITTTDAIEGHRIEAYLGIASGEAIIGANIFSDLFAGIRDVVGGRAGSYEKKIKQAKDLALEDLANEAASVGANAVIGIDLDYEVVGKSGSMLMVSANGTAVRIVPA